jgi:ubiquinone/menaquinone biosynthesis C-methylase UbiE
VDKINFDFVTRGFDAPAVRDRYIAAAMTGLWASETVVCQRYFHVTGRTLDVGAGTGRTTMGLYEKGYHDICGIDLNHGMIQIAQRLAAGKNMALHFLQMNACELAFRDGTFDSALFSYNGLMQIPSNLNRLRALREVRRIMRSGGHFIFTTQDRDDLAYRRYWTEQRRRWDEGVADPRLLEFGDGIFPDNGREVYVHFPSRAEITQALVDSGWHLVSVRDRREIATESADIEQTHCVFWVAKKL